MRRATPVTARTRIPGDLLVRPTALVALGLLIINDHWLKDRWPGVVTGKLSDVVGVFLLPLVVLAVVEVVRAVARRPWIGRPRELLSVIAATGAGFAAMKLFAGAGAVYSWTVGTLRWLPSAVAALASSDAQTSIVPVALLRDPTDVLVLPVLVLTWLVARPMVSERSALATGPTTHGPWSQSAPLPSS